MKNTLLFTFLLIQFHAFSQTALEILTNLQTTYGELTNYTDRGTYIRYSEPHTSVYVTYEYHVAIDRSENVFHWIISVDSPDPSGWEYRISADEQVGTFKRFAGNDKPEPRSLDMACASLYAVGGGILDMAARLMFPYLHDSVNAYVATMFMYDSVVYVQDTTFNGDTCQILEFFDSYQLTKEMIRHHEQRRDSILNKYPSPPGFVPPRQQPGLRRSKERYFIRSADGLIVRMDRLPFENDEYILNSSVFMYPVVNVADFERYLKY